MTKDNAKDFLPLVQALADGKTIQYQRTDGVWVDATEPSFSRGWAYRIKPEPREWWVNIYPDDPGGVAHTSRGMADNSAGPSRSACVHVREVL